MVATSEGVAAATNSESQTSAEALSLPRESGLLEGHQSYVYCVAFSPDSELLVSGSWDETARMWDLATQQEIARMRVPEESKRVLHRVVRGVGFASNDPSRPLVVRSWASVYRWDWATQELEQVWQNTNDAGTDLLVRAAFLRLAVGGSKIWASDTGERSASSYDSERWAEGCADGTIYLRSLETGSFSPGAVESQFGATQPLKAIAFHPKKPWLAAGGSDGALLVWDLESTEEPIAKLDGHADEVFSVDFSPDGTRIASGGRDGILRLWDSESFELMAAFNGHSGYIHSVVFSPDGTRIATASGDQTIRVWDSVSRSRRNQERLAELQLRQELSPRVAEHLRENDPQATAEWIRKEMVGAKQRAALRELFSRVK